MKKLIKIISIAIGLILISLIIGPFIVAMVVNPNDYKDDISELVEAQTGRTLTINGDISYSVYPWLGLRLGELQLSNSAVKGFSKKTFAKIKSADVRMKIMPLFSNKMEVDKIMLTGLNLNLEKNKHGIGNWQDLMAQTDAKKQLAPATTKSAPVDTAQDSNIKMLLPAIAGLELINANVNWLDKQSGQQYQLRDFNFTTGVIANNTPTNIDVNFSFKANQPELSGSTNLTAKILFNIEKQSITISSLKLKQAITQKMQQPNNLKLELSSDVIKADMTTQMASISNLKITVLGVELKTSLNAKNILKDIKVNGKLSINEINPSSILQTLNIQLPKMADSTVFQQAKLDIRFKAGLNKVALSKVTMLFDDTKLSGNITLRNFTKPKLRYKLHLDEINVDRYLTPQVTPQKTNTKLKKQTTPVANSPELPLPIPIELLRSLNIKGTLTIGKAVVSKLRTHDIKLKLLARKGIVRLYPISAKMYKGRYKGDIKLNVQKKMPVVTLNEKITGVSFNPMVTDFMGEDYLSGYGSGSAKLTTKGLTISAFTKNLNGNVSFNIKNAQLKYLKPTSMLSNEIKSQISKYNKKPYKKKKDKDTPDVFKVMKGSFQIKNGIAHNRDFVTKSRDVNITGKGYVDLVKRFVNYKVNFLLQKPKTNDKEINAYLKRSPITNVIKGPFTNLSYNNFNTEPLISNYIKEKIQKKVNIEKKKLNKKVKAVERSVKRQVENEVKKKLGELFK